MNTATAQKTAPEQGPESEHRTTRSTVRGSVTFPRLVRAEWIKFTTLRSTWWSLALVAAVSVGLSLLQATAIASFGDEEQASNAAAVNETAVMVIVFATVLTQLLAVIIGTINVTGEYSTGMIRSTLTAEPRRLPSMLAKALVVGGTLFVFSLVVFALAGLATAPILSDGGVDLSDPETSVMPLLGAALYLALIAIMGAGLGYIIRNGPGALAVGIGLVFVAPVIVLFFPATPDFQWVFDFAAYLPSNAGQSLFMGQPLSGELLDTWPALLTIIAWSTAAVVGGAAVVKSRDA